MEPGVILAKSERQAMDWSLVLISQGIENTIERSPETAQWQLIVSQPEYQRAIKAIKQYHVENKRGAWVQELPWSDLLLDWRAAAWALIVIAIFFANHASRNVWEETGLMNNALVAKGEWWRLFTATTLHADLGHLAVNVTMGLVLIGLAMGWAAWIVSRRSGRKPGRIPGIWGETSKPRCVWCGDGRVGTARSPIDWARARA